MAEATRDITLRTLAGDAGAITKSTQPEAVRISLHARPTSETPSETTAPTVKKNSPVVITIGAILAMLALATAGYFLYTM